MISPTLSRNACVPSDQVGSEACAICRATIFSAVRKRGPVVVGQPQRHLQMKDIQELDEVVRPAGGNRARAHGVFERQVPADDPGENFAQRGVGVGVGAAGQRNQRGEFGVAQTGETRSPVRKARTKASGRARRSARPSPDKHENSRADDRADAQRGERNRARACASGYARRRPASCSSHSIGFFANSGLRHSPCESSQSAGPHLPLSSARAAARQLPQPVHRQPEQNDDQARPSVLRFIPQQLDFEKSRHHEYTAPAGPDSRTRDRAAASPGASSAGEKVRRASGYRKSATAKIRKSSNWP